MSSTGPSIAERQNAPRGLKLLRARSEIYRRASALQKLQLVLTVLVPFITSVIGIIYPDARGYVATIAVFVTLLDVALLDRIQRTQLKLAAKVCELFDTEVLDMPWSGHVAGTQPSPEQISEAADAWSGGDKNLTDWYPVSVGRAPFHMARVICQRTNLWYDAELRRKYSGILLGSIIAGCAALIAIGLSRPISLVDFAATVLTPTAPMITWALRDFYRQRDTADAQVAAKVEVDQLWKTVISDGCGVDECSKRAREFQNTIFTRRSTSPLIFPGLYRYLRPGMEKQMNVGDSELLAQAGVD